MAGAVDFDGILAGIESLAPEVKTQAAEMADAREGAKFAARRTWDEIKEVVRGFDIGSLLDGTDEEIAGRFEDIGTRIGEKLVDLGGRWLVRLSDLIDGAVERFQQPVAAVVDFTQKIAVRLGIVDESTPKWGGLDPRAEGRGRRCHGGDRPGGRVRDRRLPRRRRDRHRGVRRPVPGRAGPGDQGAGRGGGVREGSAGGVRGR